VSVANFEKVGARLNLRHIEHIPKSSVYRPIRGARFNQEWITGVVYRANLSDIAFYTPNLIISDLNRIH
jgi:hypothetical protein